MLLGVSCPAVARCPSQKQIYYYIIINIAIFATARNRVPPTYGDVENQNYPFYEVVKIWNELHHCVPPVKMVKKHTYNV